MDAVRTGHGATIQPGAAMVRLGPGECNSVPLQDSATTRRNLLASLSEDELSPAALAARVVLTEVARTAVSSGRWRGATLHKN